MRQVAAGREEGPGRKEDLGNSPRWGDWQLVPCHTQCREGADLGAGDDFQFGDVEVRIGKTSQQ